MLYVNLNEFSGKIIFRLTTQKQLFSSEPFGIAFWNVAVFWESMMGERDLSTTSAWTSWTFNLNFELHWEFTDQQISAITLIWPTECLPVVPWQKFCSSRVNPGEHGVSPALWCERVCGFVGFSGLWGTGSAGCDDSSSLLTKICAFWGRQR